MGNVDRCIKTLPLNEMMYHVRRDAGLRARWLTDLEGIAREFGLSTEELDALRNPALEAYKRAYPEEAARSQRLQDELEKRGR